MHSADLRTKGRIISPAPNLSPTSFIAGSRVSFKVFTAASCNSSLDERARTSFNDEFDFIFEEEEEEEEDNSISFVLFLSLTLSKIAPKTSYSIPSRSLFTIL